MHGSKQARMNHICQVQGIKVDIRWLSCTHYIPSAHLVNQATHTKQKPVQLIPLKKLHKIQESNRS